jgi:hypothetical protein
MSSFGIPSLCQRCGRVHTVLRNGTKVKFSKRYKRLRIAVANDDKNDDD